MALSFGTDGIRGRAHDQLTVDQVARIARAAGRVLGASAVAIGRDTRASGPAFVDALARGFAEVGVESWDLGVAPTPAVAHAAAAHGVIGAVVSASHNPWHDNGVKIFAPGGRKLTDAQQAALEADLAADEDHAGDPSVAVAAGPAAVVRHELVDDYADACVAAIDGGSLAGLHVVADTANGAASAVAGPALDRLGATVDVICDEPDGRNINEACGSTDMDALCGAVVDRGADMGVAFDGDADRLLAVDHRGRVVDGDHIIAICARDLRDRGLLADDTVVVTVMTNLGFRLAMAEAGIAVHETPVGDRHVLEALESHGWSLGGEQSGHIIFADRAPTGDALLTAVLLCDVVARSGRSLADLAAAAMTQLPQQLMSVTVADGPAAAMERVAPVIAAVQAGLGSTGRLLVRPSGTEPLVRVMAEAPVQDAADAAVAAVVAALTGA